MNPDAMLARVPSPLLSEWMAFYTLDHEDMEAATNPDKTESKHEDLKNKLHFMHAMYGGNLEVA